MMNNDRGRGGTGPRKPNTVIPRIGVSPQLCPPTYVMPSPKSGKPMTKG